jgi:peroxiredoxin
MRWQSMMMELGCAAPAFALPDGNGKRFTLHDFDASKGLLVAFFCNHCPAVQHIVDEFVAMTAEYAPQGLATVAISCNDIEAHPEDGPDFMVSFAAERRFGFPYLYDADQSVARAFGAVCTPDFFLYDRQRKLYYRGQFDSTRPVTIHTQGNPGAGAKPSGADMRAAVASLLADRPPPAGQKPSMGCSVKWKPGNDPDEN